jgi:GNAT superfamily N-acetyltransferase
LCCQEHLAEGSAILVLNTTTVSFAKETYAEVISEIKRLLELHWEEIALLKDKIPLDPNYAKYEELDKLGIMHFLTVRNETGELVGYNIFSVMPHIHYWSTPMALIDIMFLEKPYRKGRNGIRFLQFFEQEAKKLGAKKLIGGTKEHFDIGKLFEYLGWTPTDRMYTKWVGG